jgi:hypothetical protein
MLGYLTGSLLGFIGGGVGYYTIMKAGDVIAG